ncbi:hypothetical protein ACTWP5_00870 [Streptomyces sp. 4N509B]|uniref:hypothetical protein n=1 Tax=Streptomyces sp. 4N509B TaxID=3457413 RepID=UPI003FD15DCB
MNHRIDDLVRDTLTDRAGAAPPADRVVDRVLAGAPARRRRAGWLVMGSVAASAAAAVVAVVGVGVVLDSGSPRSPGESVDAHASEREEGVANDRAVAIYAAVLERFLRESYEDDGGVPESVLVGFRPEESAGWEYDDPEVGAPLPPAVRDALVAELADVTDLVWVERLPSPGGPADEELAGITLGLLPDGDREVRVSVSALHGFNNGWLTTYVVEKVGDRWSVTGVGSPNGIT